MCFLVRALVVTMLAAPAVAWAQAPHGPLDNPAPHGGTAYFEFEVEKPVATRPDNPHPAYPESLRRRGVPGEVRIQFVVDTAGRPDMATFEVLKSSDQSLTGAVKDVVPSLRFFPAESGGHKVRQLVEQAFRFAP